MDIESMRDDDPNLETREAAELSELDQKLADIDEVWDRYEKEFKKLKSTIRTPEGIVVTVNGSGRLTEIKLPRTGIGNSRTAEKSIMSAYRSAVEEVDEAGRRINLAMDREFKAIDDISSKENKRP